MTHTTRFVALNRHLPTGRIEPDHFTITEKELPEPHDGRLLLRPIAFSIDATPRGQLTGVEGG